MSRRVKHNTSIEAESVGPSFVVSVTISNNEAGTVLIRDKDWCIAMHNSLHVPLKDVPALIQELQWALDRCGELE